MNGNAEMLNYVYQNSQMGVKTLSHLIDMVESENFTGCLKNQLEGYQDINDQAKKMLNQNGYDEKGISEMEKVMTYWMINMKTIKDKSPSHIAEMLLQGSNMGIIEATKKIHQYDGEAENDILSLMYKLREMEEDYVEELKKYL